MKAEDVDTVFIYIERQTPRKCTTLTGVLLCLTKGICLPVYRRFLYECLGTFAFELKFLKTWLQSIVGSNM